MSTTQRAVLIIVFVIWMIGMPLAFATLYSVIELQSAARAASKDDNRLSTLRTAELAGKLEQARRSNSRADALASARDKAWIDVTEARAIGRLSVIDYLARHGVSGATALCTGSPADVTSCQLKQDQTACYNDWAKANACYEQAVTVPLMIGQSLLRSS